MNESIMYNSVTAVSELNKVEGFNPLDYMRKIVEDDITQLYLDVKYRKLWFRLKYPNGKIRKRIVKLDEKVAIIESYIYLDKSDSEENYIASALAQRSSEVDGKYSDKFVEIAETASVGRALADAGFGVQFCDSLEPADANVVDAPFEINTVTGEVIEEDDTPLPYDPIAPMEENMIIPPSQSKSEKSTATKPSTKTTSKSVELSPNMSCDELYKIMTVDDAKRVVVSFGINKGQTLAQIATHDPKDLVWYVQAYKGNNNILKTAAKILLDAANA